MGAGRVIRPPVISAQRSSDVVELALLFAQFLSNRDDHALQRSRRLLSSWNVLRHVLLGWGQEIN